MKNKLLNYKLIFKLQKKIIRIKYKIMKIRFNKIIMKKNIKKFKMIY